MDVTEWIIEWFSKNSNVELNTIKDNLQEDYLAKCWIDSLKFVEFISDIETEFKIQFSNMDFQDRSFSTVQGLIKAIEERMNG